MIYFHLFGSFDVGRADASATIPLGAHARQLFSFLLSFPNQNHRRERLADLFWPELDAERARHTLNTALWRIRRVLQVLPECPGVALVSGHRDVRLGLADEDHVDVHRFVRLAESEATETVAGLQAAVQLYRGPYLDGDDNDWIVPCRERFHCLYVRALNDLLRRHAREGRLEEALDCGRRILAADPLREHVQREVMLLYVLNGQSARALRQFARCADLLREECGVEPMPETVELVERIRDGTVFAHLPVLAAAAFSDAPGRCPPAAAAAPRAELRI